MHIGYGTAYEFQTDGDVWAISATFRFNLVAKILGENGKKPWRTLYRRDNRPGVIRALSLAGAVFFLPWAVFMIGP